LAFENFHIYFQYVGLSEKPAGAELHIFHRYLPDRVIQIRKVSFGLTSTWQGRVPASVVHGKSLVLRLYSGKSGPERPGTPFRVPTISLNTDPGPYVTQRRSGSVRHNVWVLAGPKFLGNRYVACTIVVHLSVGNRLMPIPYRVLRNERRWPNRLL